MKIKLPASKLEVDMVPKIKICGLTDSSEVSYLADSVDYAGIVMFFEKSKRNNTPETAVPVLAAIKELAKDGIHIKTVAVVVSPDVEQVKLIEALGFDIIQIHGELKPEVLENIKIPIFRAYNLESESDIEELANEPKIYGILFDGKVPGSGNTFDWSMLKAFDRKDKLLILAGGLDETNIADAIREVSPDIVDVSSGVEYKDAKTTGQKGKDPERIKAFIAAVKHADQQNKNEQKEEKI